MIGEILIKRLSLIGHLSDADRAALLEIKGHAREVGRHEDLLRAGDPNPGESIIVLSGLLQRYTTSTQGARQINSFYLPTDTPSLETIHIDYMDNNLGAVAPSRVGIVPHAELFKAMEAAPGLTRLFWRETLVQASVFRGWLMRNSQLIAHEQMAHFFCEMITRARAAGLSDGNSCDLSITQEDLGAALGMSPVHVNRTLMVLREAGLVEFARGKLTVHKWQTLAETAEFNPGYLHLRAEA